MYAFSPKGSPILGTETDEFPSEPTEHEEAIRE